MFVMVQENRGPTLNMARSLINRPNGQLFDSESESESGKKNVKKEKKQQKEQEKRVAKN